MRHHRNKLSQPGIARLAGLFALLVLCALLAMAVVYRMNIYDWWQLRDYQAPPDVASLAAQDTMTGYARKIFYVNHPSIEDKTTFNQNCPNNGGEQTIVLGCYHGDQGGIYALSVNDPRLSGVEQVTAAHEMLHAAYDRLSVSERKKVDAMLMDYYDHDLHDQRVLNTIAAYKKTEPNDVVNEMHSVFGSEVANLPAGLEQYYARYFANRAVVAAAAARYQDAFTSRQAAVAADDNQLASWKTQITNEENDLKAKQAAIETQKAQLLSERNRGDINAYNAGVPSYNDQIQAYNNEVQSLQNLVNQYNQLVSSRNAIALEEDQLVNDLTASATPINQ